MRILIVDTCYPAFLAAHYGQHPELRHRGYAEQWRALMDAFFGTADSYSHHLTALGHPAHEFVVNCGWLQNRWAAEHGLSARTPTSHGEPRARDELLLAQAEAFRPDVCYVQNLEALRPRTLRELSGRGYLLVGQASTEPPGRHRLRLFDLLVSPLPFLVERFRDIGVQCEYLPLAFDERVLEHIPQKQENEDYGAVFVGSLKRFRRWRSNRLIERAAHDVPVDFWGYGAEQWPRSSPIRQHFHGEVWGLDMFRVLAASRLGLNRHGDFTRGYACNMRLYEATGVGTLLLTDGRKNLDELFEPGVELIRYQDEFDLAEKIRYYLDADDERREIARAGQARTLANHTYSHRMAQLAEVLERELGTRRAS